MKLRKFPDAYFFLFVGIALLFCVSVSQAQEEAKRYPNHIMWKTLGDFFQGDFFSQGYSDGIKNFFQKNKNKPCRDRYIYYPGRQDNRGRFQADGMLIFIFDDEKYLKKNISPQKKQTDPYWPPGVIGLIEIEYLRNPKAARLATFQQKNPDGTISNLVTGISVLSDGTSQ